MNTLTKLIGLRRNRRVLIVGDGPLAYELREAVERRPHLGYEVVDVLPLEENADTRCAPPVQQLQEAITLWRPRWIIWAPRDRRGNLPATVLLPQRVHGVRVSEGTAAYELITGKLAIEALSPSAILFGTGFVESELRRILARLGSVVAASAGLVVAAPAMLGIAAVIKLDSPGPVFFVQKRIGLEGSTFNLMKFRTMHAGVESRSLWVRDNCHRLTRVGRVLRRYRIDELPQLINVLRGEMNLIGPRPHPVANHAMFAETIPYYWLRTLIRPGLTGWAQVRYGYANDIEEETEKVRYDLYYIKHRSLLLDLKIIWATVGAVLKGGGEETAEASAIDEIKIPAVTTLSQRHASDSDQGESMSSGALAHRAERVAGRN